MIIDAEQIWTETYRSAINYHLSHGTGAPQSANLAKTSADEALRVWKERTEEIRKEAKEKWVDVLENILQARDNR